MTKIWIGNREWELDEKQPIMQIIGNKDKTGTMTAILHHGTVKLITKKGNVLVAPRRTIFRIHESQILAPSFKKGDFVNCEEEIKPHG